VFQGICTASLKYNNTLEAMIRVWYHENMRVFSDRLIEEQDREFIRGCLAENFKQFGVEQKAILNSERIIFCDFYLGKDVDPRHYMQVPDLKELIKKIYDMMEEYNSDSKFSGAGGKNKMKLVLFLDACEHISRISRVLRQPLGNALLLGVGGSGRQSLAKLATFISNHCLFQIEVIKGYSMKSWREDVKKCLLQAGL
jgi:dynein heavy chain